MKSLLSVSVLSLILVSAALYLTSCYTSSSANRAPAPPVDSMAELLRRQPNVQVFGSGGNIRVQIRARKTMMTSGEPLYLIDGIRVGNDFSSIATLNPGDVDRIKVVRDPADLAGYGLGAANGVIEVILKK